MQACQSSANILFIFLHQPEYIVRHHDLTILSMSLYNKSVKGCQFATIGCCRSGVEKAEVPVNLICTSPTWKTVRVISYLGNSAPATLHAAHLRLLLPWRPVRRLAAGSVTYSQGLTTKSQASWCLDAPFPAQLGVAACDHHTYQFDLEKISK